MFWATFFFNTHKFLVVPLRICHLLELLRATLLTYFFVLVQAMHRFKWICKTCVGKMYNTEASHLHCLSSAVLWLLVHWQIQKSIHIMCNEVELKCHEYYVAKRWLELFLIQLLHIKNDDVKKELWIWNAYSVLIWCQKRGNYPLYLNSMVKTLCSKLARQPLWWTSKSHWFESLPRIQKWLPLMRPICIEQT